MTILHRITIATLLASAAAPQIGRAQPAPPAPAPDATAQPPATADAPPAPDAAAQPPAAPDAAAQPPVAPPAAPAPAPAVPGVPKGPEWTTLRLLHDKGVISDAELESALKDLAIVGAGDATTLVLAKLKTTIYGNIEANYRYDTTQTCNESCGSTQVQRPGTYRGEHGRTVFSPRRSRFGLRIAAPEEHGIRLSALLDGDFLGPTATTEQGLFSNPVLRIANSYLRMETPVVDVLLGQTWSLFGWQPSFLVASVQPAGIPGQLFERTLQLRVSKTIKTSAVTAEVAVAANRPPQQDSATPEGIAGLRLSFPDRSGQHTTGMGSTAIVPASIAVSGDLRKFRIPEFSATPHTGHVRVGGGVAVDVYLPIVPATRQSKDNALAISAELAIGSGTSDMYSALAAAGTANATLPPPAMGAAPVYPANFDPGLAAVDANGHIELIKWTSYIASVEFYPAGTGGRLGTFANYGHMESSNAKTVGTASSLGAAMPSASAIAAAARIRDHEELYEAGLFVDPTKATRIAASGSLYDDTYGDGGEAKNYSVMMTGFLFF
jgi:hypothetical protein